MINKHIPRFSFVRISTQLLLLAALMLLQSCTSGPQIKAHLVWLNKQIQDHQKDGAQRCAPYVFANAKAETEFTEVELFQGQHIRAELHRQKAIRWMKLTKSEMEPFKRKKELWKCRGEKPPKAKVKPKPKPRKIDPCSKDTDNDNIPDCRDLCVEQPEDNQGFEDNDGCPDGTRDSDTDGIPDYKDQCPLEPEDNNGFQSHDGCPDKDIDTDNDGVPDAKDKCPLVPAKSPNGCPVIVKKKYKLIVVTEKKIELKQKVYFATSRSKIRQRSYALLREVATALKDYPKLYVCIEGHTDSRGRRGYNLRLSRNRSNAVRKFLVKQGIDSLRMRNRGYGPKHPIDSNSSRSGRAANRRVEFRIVKSSKEACPLDLQ